MLLADHTNGGAYITVLHLSVCDVMYCGYKTVLQKVTIDSLEEVV